MLANTNAVKTPDQNAATPANQDVTVESEIRFRELKNRLKNLINTRNKNITLSISQFTAHEFYDKATNPVSSFLGTNAKSLAEQKKIPIPAEPAALAAGATQEEKDQYAAAKRNYDNAKAQVESATALELALAEKQALHQAQYEALNQKWEKKIAQLTSSIAGADNPAAKIDRLHKLLWKHKVALMRLHDQQIDDLSSFYDSTQTIKFPEVPEEKGPPPVAARPAYEKNISLSNALITAYGLADNDVIKIKEAQLDALKKHQQDQNNTLQNAYNTAVIDQQIVLHLIEQQAAIRFINAIPGNFDLDQKMPVTVSSIELNIPLNERNVYCTSRGTKMFVQGGTVSMWHVGSDINMADIREQLILCKALGATEVTIDISYQTWGQWATGDKTQVTRDEAGISLAAIEAKLMGFKVFVTNKQGQKAEWRPNSKEEAELSRRRQQMQKQFSQYEHLTKAKAEAKADAQGNLALEKELIKTKTATNLELLETLNVDLNTVTELNEKLETEIARLIEAQNNAPPSYPTPSKIDGLLALENSINLLIKSEFLHMEELSNRFKDDKGAWLKGTEAQRNELASFLGPHIDQLNKFIEKRTERRQNLVQMANGLREQLIQQRNEYQATLDAIDNSPAFRAMPRPLTAEDHNIIQAEKNPIYARMHSTDKEISALARKQKGLNKNQAQTQALIERFDEICNKVNVRPEPVARQPILGN